MRSLLLTMCVVFGMSATAQDYPFETAYLNSETKVGIQMSGLGSTREGGLAFYRNTNNSNILLVLQTDEYMYEGEELLVAWFDYFERRTAIKFIEVKKRIAQGVYVLSLDLEGEDYFDNMLDDMRVIINSDYDSYIFSLRGSTSAYNFVKL